MFTFKRTPKQPIVTICTKCSVVIESQELLVVKGQNVCMPCYNGTSKVAVSQPIRSKAEWDEIWVPSR
jgi:formylmethanofuran dehydrogenase subunit E